MSFVTFLCAAAAKATEKEKKDNRGQWKVKTNNKPVIKEASFSYKNILGKRLAGLKPNLQSLALALVHASKS
jgi:hypothetical protein